MESIIEPVVAARPDIHARVHENRVNIISKEHLITFTRSRVTVRGKECIAIASSFVPTREMGDLLASSKILTIHHIIADGMMYIIPLDFYTVEKMIDLLIDLLVKYKL